MSILGFAIIGCGNIAPFHAEALKNVSGANLVSVCDINYDKAVQLAERYDAEAYYNYHMMLMNKAVDVVIVCLPSSMHEDFAVQAAEAGKHVIIEKPLDISLTKCDAIISACERNNVKLSVIFPCRFKDAAMVLMNAVNKGRFGRITIADVQVKWFRSQEYYDTAGWRGTWEYDGGGALMNQSIHYIDLLQSYMGQVDSVYAYCDTLARKIEVEDTAVAVLKFKNGAMATIQGATSTYPGLDVRIGIHGTDGSAILNGESLEVWEFKEMSHEDTVLKRSLQNTSSSGAKDPTAFIDFKGHQYQIEDMIDAIKNNREPKVNGHEGRKSVAIISAIYESARTGKMVKL